MLSKRMREVVERMLGNETIVLIQDDPPLLKWKYWGIEQRQYINHDFADELLQSGLLHRVNVIDGSNSTFYRLDREAAAKALEGEKE